MDIEDYVDAIKVILGETAKYLALLLFSVLAIRLWRRRSGTAAGKKGQNFLLACLSGAAACGIGYFSIGHSLSLLYYYYGNKAFDAGNYLPAASLFQTSFAYWKNADALGREGICLLLADEPDRGMRRLDEAKALRKGGSSSFEQFNAGMYFFFHEQPDQAVPLLEASSAKAGYQWNVARLLSVIALEKGRPDEAERIMKPYLRAEVKDGDYAHAYVVASLKLREGNQAEARSIIERFPSGKLTPFWKPRFEKLRTKT